MVTNELEKYIGTSLYVGRYSVLIDDTIEYKDGHIDVCLLISRDDYPGDYSMIVSSDTVFEMAAMAGIITYPNGETFYRDEIDN